MSKFNDVTSVIGSDQMDRELIDIMIPTKELNRLTWKLLEIGKN